MGSQHPQTRNWALLAGSGGQIDAPTLERITANHVLPGSVVVKNAWTAYGSVNKLNNGVYQHEAVNSRAQIRAPSSFKNQHSGYRGVMDAC